MVKQLEGSIDHDTTYTPDKPTREDASSFLKTERERAKRNVEYHREKEREELERAKEGTEWIRALRESVTG
jgi:hypothetical protein